jgi:hypothetical protein
MMSDIRRRNMIPAEQFATTGHTAIDGVMAKQLGFFDKANTLHITAAVNQVDVEQCYDAVLHSVTSVGLQAHHVPLTYVLLYLHAMAEMQFHLRTGFGRDNESFDGAVGRYFVGLGQGSGGAPSAWQVVSGMMLGAYKRAGYSVEMRMAWSNFLFVVAMTCFLSTTVIFSTCVWTLRCRIWSFLLGSSTLCIFGPSFLWLTVATSVILSALATFSSTNL